MLVHRLDDHMVESHGHKPSQFRCEHCPKSFAWRPNLLKHKMVHGEYRRFPCEICDKVFTDPSNLQVYFLYPIKMAILLKNIRNDC